MELLECLVCGHAFWPRKPVDRLKSRRQCRKCWSASVYSETEIIKFLMEVRKEVLSQGKLKVTISDVLDSMAVVIGRKKMKLNPRATINLVKKVLHSFGALDKPL